MENISNEQAKHGVIKNSKHNAAYKLVETTIFDGSRFIGLVYGETNEGKNKGLEAYFKRKKDGHFYRSYRWLEGSIPEKYKRYYEVLHPILIFCEAGHKITVQLINE